ncbi:MAG TPA: selenide, water dikinase SelD [Acetobacteraceae bacterium]|nr:selenide, water dikinase SelD [Acetobacteraceae bacterium]
MRRIVAAQPTRRKPAKLDGMQPRASITTDIVLLGAGHAHVEVLRRFAKRPEPGVRLTLIGREPETPYTGMLPGLIRGDYTFDQAHIDLAPLAVSAGARLILAEASAIDLAGRHVEVNGRPDVPFDLLSIDIGGEPAMPSGGGQPVKPIGQFLVRLSALEATLQPNARIAVVGGGAGGTELALALARRYREQARIVLVCDTPEPLATAPSYARSVARTALVDAGVELVCGVRAGGWADGRLALSDGSFLEVATAFWATGVVGPAFLATSGLACDAVGCVRVNATLRSASHDFVFAAGDCAAIEGNPRPKAGVWAVRAGAPLAANLRRAARGQALRRWRPQSDALAILGLGDGRALAWRNGIAVSGRAVWRWKDWIDRRWMRMYQEPMAPMQADDPMRCGGCGAKVGAEVLAGALAGLPRLQGPDVLIGLDAPDDAAVMLPPRGMAVVQSVDHFRAFIDDPFVFGEIAAAHALSDLHAMGARPWTALAVAAVPYSSGARMRTELADMLQGASRVLTADGCTLVGGHSAEAAESALGFAVTGLADPTKLLRKTGLREGDALVLTKPLGTGIVLAGNMQGLARSAWLTATIASMRMSNATASRILRDFDATACTDVTGFGLAGHLLEMLRASGVSAVLWSDQIPALPGALELATHGVQSTLAPENRRSLPTAGTDARAALVFDPQTSGGLLAGITWGRAENCVTALRSHGVAATIVGVVERGDTALRMES